MTDPIFRTVNPDPEMLAAFALADASAVAIMVGVGIFIAAWAATWLSETFGPGASR